MSAARRSVAATTAGLRVRHGTGTTGALRVLRGTAMIAGLLSGVGTTGVRLAGTTGTIAIAGVPRLPAERISSVPGGCWTASR
jgi:hypothetical protein